MSDYDLPNVSKVAQFQLGVYLFSPVYIDYRSLTGCGISDDDFTDLKGCFRSIGRGGIATL